MNRLELRDRWVVVTGASSGLGRAFARRLAREHAAKLVLVARNRQRLESLAAELAHETNTQSRVVVADLTRPDDVDRVYRESIAAGDIHAVILNAGVTYFGRHTELSFREFESMLATNVTSVVRLTSLFVPYLVERASEGGILIISSLGGAVPLPYQAAYSGTKAFLLNFAQALAYELRREPLSITVFATGGIDTEMNEKSGLALHFKGPPAVVPADVCARQALDAFARRRPLGISGWFNRLNVLLMRVVPARAMVKVIGATYERALATKKKARG